VIEVGEVTAHTEKSSVKWFPWGNWPLADQVATITVPITIRVSEKLLSALYETLNSLGGGTNFTTNLNLTYLVPTAVAEYVVDKRWGPISRHLNEYEYRRGDFARVNRASEGFSLVPSGNQNLNEYFYQRCCTSRVPVIEFVLQGGKNYSCTVPSIVNRIFSTAGYGSNYSVFLSRNSDTPVSDSAILLTKPIKLYVEVQLSGERAEQLERVMGRFETMDDSPSNTCRIILEEF
jgi:hypothetical protein